MGMMSMMMGSSAAPLGATTDKSTVSGSCSVGGFGGSCNATTDAVTASPINAVGSITYAWEGVGGTFSTINSPSSATTTFSRSGPVGSETGTSRCKLTDAATGQVAYTPNVTVDTTHTS